MTKLAPSERTTLKRMPDRAEYDRALIYSILDEGFICQVGFVVDNKPVVIPTAYARDGDEIYIHGSQASRMMRVLKGGVEACLTVTLVDGLVLARSAFNHSMNYRSVVVFGKASVIEDENEKLKAMRAFSEHILEGRWDDVRQPSATELKATTVLSLPLIEVSAKIRSGPPIDDEEDYDLDVWAGEMPLHLQAAEAIGDPLMKADISAPEYLSIYRKSKAAAREYCG